jgi:hypothetical protein
VDDGAGVSVKKKNNDASTYLMNSKTNENGYRAGFIYMYIITKKTCVAAFGSFFVGAWQ